MALADAILELLSRSTSVEPNADFSIISTLRSDPSAVHLATSRSGKAALLVPVAGAPGGLTRSTRSLLLRATDTMEFSNGASAWREPAVVVECRDEKLVRSFAVMIAAIVGRLPSDSKPTWNHVAALFGEWETLLARRHLLDGESELGLWGEVWCLARSARASELLRGWDGPAGAEVDFVLDGMGLEVKTSRRPCIHQVSQRQLDEPLGGAPHLFLSLHVGLDPMHGKSLSELVQEAIVSVANAPEFEERLATVGYAREDDDAYGKRYKLLRQPLVFPARSIPRIRAADPGVSRMRYQVELDPGDALLEDDEVRVMTAFGLDRPGEVYPCV